MKENITFYPISDYNQIQDLAGDYVLDYQGNEVDILRRLTPKMEHGGGSYDDCKKNIIKYSIIKEYIVGESENNWFIINWKTCKEWRGSESEYEQKLKYYGLNNIYYTEVKKP